ncbi:MAG: aminodeoxychorismate synthase component I [Gammaproteobacteria bacterium]|nr:aminodeoxychorismate synthase component I [Gammaproteobacteria bacterium]
MKPTALQFPYREHSAELFARLAGRPWSAFLDSGRPGSMEGRYDIMTSDPHSWLLTHGATTTLVTPEGESESSEDPFSLLQRLLGVQLEPLRGIPFYGGAIGWFGYDLARRIERLPSLAEHDAAAAEMAIGIYDWALVVDHQRRRSWVVGVGDAPRQRRPWLLEQQRQGGRHTDPFATHGALLCDISHDDYLHAFARIQAYIRAGDCYQVNFARRFSINAEGDPWPAYLRLRELSAAPYAAYLNTPGCCVLSSSPERFLSCRDGRVETRPIKGTAARGATVEADRRLAEALQQSPKDRAENLMIVDLLRNDIGKVCVPGSVEVPELFKLESFSRVHHLVSTVQGSLADGESSLSLLRACFPGGSITGAPKLRAMQIIEELEPYRRGLYCGAIGYIGYDGDMDTNIAIRTLQIAQSRASFWAGGGIVADSDPEQEYQETYHKGAALIDLLQQARR